MHLRFNARCGAVVQQQHRGAALGEALLQREDLPPVAQRILDAVAKARNSKSAEVALAWMIAQKGITAPIASATTLEQVDSLVRASRLILAEEEIRSLTDASG